MCSEDCSSGLMAHAFFPVKHWEPMSDGRRCQHPCHSRVQVIALHGHCMAEKKWKIRRPAFLGNTSHFTLELQGSVEGKHTGPGERCGVGRQQRNVSRPCPEVLLIKVCHKQSHPDSLILVLNQSAHAHCLLCVSR